MSRIIWMESYDTSGKLADTSIYHPLKYDENRVLRYVRAVLVFVGAPAFTDLRMNIYGNDEQNSPSPSKLLHTSTNSWTLSDLMTEDHGWKDVWFKFTDFHARAGIFYNCVLSGSGYTPTTSSFLALEKAYPNPIQQKGYIPSTVNVNVSPFKVYGIGDDL